MNVREAARHVSPGAVIRALFTRLSPEAQQALVDSLKSASEEDRRIVWGVMEELKGIALNADADRENAQSDDIFADPTPALTEEDHALAIRDEVFEDGTPCMTSVWEPTPAELAMLNAGGAVVLRILGRQFPPVIMETQPAPVP